MCTTPVLAVPIFNNTFVLEWDTLGRGLRAMLMQKGRPLEFTSKTMCDHKLGKPTYEKEMVVVLHAVDTWHPYLTGRCFHINIDHNSSNYSLEQ